LSGITRSIFKISSFRPTKTTVIVFFTEAAMIAALEIWNMRNDKVFGRREPNQVRWLCNFKSQCLLQSVRFKVDLRSTFRFWLDAFS
jgi:hypothetical protein